ncbi:hypothetical protein DL762_003404 [Monosporascus cannonballus]|uniref:Enoyl reductase (ER) domain-containing protein n=1 Tax=Monosporascus cannonballus TaxID=155416 RepID=A0ABY0HAS6_9PEZI|nr:hypothetical protein DL763_006439 [Monosporascus cannonballus]RYO89124.1 hypothetical protein DL762_003404 [Monosporascus cannonballus]
MPRVLTLEKTEGKPGEVYYPLQLKETPKPRPGPGEVLVRIHAASLNHRDHFMRQHLYPGISFESPLLADGVGTVTALGPSCSARAADHLLHRRVLLTPSRGWASDPAGPEDPKKFAIVGGSRAYPAVGYAQDWIAVPEAEVEPCPDHLSHAEAAALPLVGLTAWRALVTKAGAPLIAGDETENGRRFNVLVTGIGGGVALAALQFAVARGCDVWVTSSSAGKIERAVALGARGGVSYRDSGDGPWEKQLAALLPHERPYLDAVIDGAGGDIVTRTVRLLRPGGIIANYGMTIAPKMDWHMGAVLQNIELRGSTMGSRAEFADMVAFVRERRIAPIVSRVARGLDDIAGIEALFEDMREGRQFGKLVVEISSSTDGDAEAAADAKL